eukprot:CAMPEP_0197436634 /NCGR_PEP_ID=MMETSP1175-20131217/4060_1 /TAXON_ID=1003142 /ORGANISM="Triceratium dubium, Strain CCMP147" /LENGTH=231 /DNA_ID=CAMNT_0042965969 /DNA_START=182 /DNA_END=877 /DNA_ORIENTATION=+
MVASAMKLFPSWSSGISAIDDARGKAYAFRCAKKRQWGRLRDLLLRVESTQLGLADVDADGRTLLHVVCSHEPPLDVVTGVAHKFPTMTDATDATQRTPLHEAVTHDASMEVVKFLAKTKPECTTMKDANGKTPLMLVCQEIGQIEDRQWLDASQMERRLLYLCDLANSLVKSVPMSVLAEDKEGMTALEHAINSEAPKKMIRVLQHTTCRLMRKMNLESRKSNKESIAAQ